MILYIDYKDDSVYKLKSLFNDEFKNYDFCYKSPHENILDSIIEALNNKYNIPLVFISEKVFNKFGHHIFYEIKSILHLSKMIFLSSADKITHLSKNIKSIGFYTHITKKYLKKNLFLTVNEAIKNYNLHMQLENSYKKDSLTGLFNRNALLKDLKKPTPAKMLLINIDDFRNINYTFGYQTGDAILKDFSNILDKLTIHNSYRLISDEFVVLCENLSNEEADELANSIKLHFQDKIFIYGEDEVNLTVSIAISEKKESLIEDAREAIRNSMKTQKNNIICVTDEHKKNTSGFSMKHLRLAFAKDQIIPFYQGIRNNKTGQIEKYECLVRLRDENNQLLAPHIFLELAQSMGLMTKVTKTVLRKSFEYFSKHAGDFSINLTEDDLKECYIVDFIKEESAKNNISLNRVTFEILENINVENSNIIAEQIMQLKELGCKIAFDDFGCEKSNFSRLLDLNIDIVKIDSMFIKNIHTNEKSFKLARAITRLAKDFDCEVVAEGVECEEIQSIIEDLGIDYTQGYYYSKPQEYV